MKEIADFIVLNQLNRYWSFSSSGTNMQIFLHNKKD